MQTETTFGAWLRHQRRHFDLTQAELATRLGYSVVTIRKLEQDLLRPSKHLVERLSQFLGVDVTQRSHVMALARTSAMPVSLPDGQLHQGSVSSHLPLQLTPFFGRTVELLHLGQALTDPACRLLTLVGPGGMGKTRLAIEAAQARVPHTLHGVHFVALASLDSAEHIVPAIAEAIDFEMHADSRPLQQQLFDYLRPKQLLLILDNFEHLRDGKDLIEELLQCCPDLRLLVTARERLHLSAEFVLRLDGLDFPSGAHAQKTHSYSAVQLFVDTARRTHPKFVLDAASEQAVVRICRLVGGMPLAIILAAAWVAVLSPVEIVDELNRGFGFLEAELHDLPDRQRSMKAVLAQSWQRLTEGERAVFMRMSIFRGGFTRPAAEQVAGASLRTLGGLVHKSLVQRDAGGRYSIHELLRQYAEAELEAADQTADACAAHCAYYTGFLQEREVDLKGRRQIAALDEIEADFENVRAAWQLAVTQRDYAAVDRGLESLYWFCEMRSRYHEGLELLRSAREQLAPPSGEAPHPVWGRLMSHVLGQDYWWFEPPTESRGRIEAGLVVAQAHDNQAEIAFCLWRLAIAMLLCEDVVGAIACLKQGIDRYGALKDYFYLSILQCNLASLHVAWDQAPKGDQLISMLVQTANLCQETGNLAGQSQSLMLLGWGLYSDGRYAEAQAHWQEAHALCLQIGARNVLTNVQLGLAWLALFDRGDFHAARALAEDLQHIASGISAAQSHLSTLIVTGFLAGTEEDYRRCYDTFQQAIAFNFPDFSYITALESIGFCLAACGLDDVPGARQHLRQALEISLKNQWPANAAKALAIAAVLMAKAGRYERASELLGLVAHHPHSPKGWLRQWPRIPRLCTELETILTRDVYIAAWERGKKVDLMPTAEAVMAELGVSDLGSTLTKLRRANVGAR